MEAPVDDTDARVEVEDEAPVNFAEEGKLDIAPGISSQMLMVLEAYGWVILLGLMVFFYVRAKWRRNNPPMNDGIEYDADQAFERQEAMDAARQRMQEKLNVRAAQYAEEQKIKEDEKRKAKIEDWDRHRQGKGYRSKYRPVEEESPSAPKSKPAEKKKPLRNADYNPLTGEGGGGSCSYRPGRPRGGGGG